MSEINIPKEHLEIFSFYLGLPKKVKTQILKKLNSYKGDLNPREIVEYLSPNVSLEKKKLFDVVLIYINLINSKNSFEGSTDEFISLISNSLISNSSDIEIFVSDEMIIDLKNLLSSGSFLATRAKIVDLMMENPRNFLDAKIYQDLKTSFDEDGKVIGSAVVHNLKLIVREGKREKEIFVYLDNRDLQTLLDEIKKSQENTKLISSTFKNGNIIDL